MHRHYTLGYAFLAMSKCWVPCSKIETIILLGPKDRSASGAPLGGLAGTPQLGALGLKGRGPFGLRWDFLYGLSRERVISGVEFGLVRLGASPRNRWDGVEPGEAWLLHPTPTLVSANHSPAPQVPACCLQFAHGSADQPSAASHHAGLQVSPPLLSDFHLLAPRVYCCLPACNLQGLC